jgi:hypothetical protein
LKNKRKEIMNYLKNTSITLTLLSLLSTTVFANQEGGSHQGPPPEAYTACEGKSTGDTAEFTSPRGDTVTGTCETERGDSSGKLVLRPDHNKQGGGSSQSK